MTENGFRPEEPRIVSQDDVLYRLAEHIADWVSDGARLRSESAWIAGVYGERGSGKTSLLWTVHDILNRRHEKAASRGTAAPCVLPNASKPGQAIFTPAATRIHDDILFMLLDHLKTRRRPNRPWKGFSAARSAEVRRKDLARFLQYEQEVASSSREVPRRLVEVHSSVAQTTSRLRTAFDRIIDSLKDKKEVLPIFVDDLDLQPQRALELLEILHLFMNVPGVVVLIAADKELLLRSIERALKEKERNADYPGLASALLAKYIPHEWLLPTPSERERGDLLWDVTPSELRRWWQDDALHGLREARAARRGELDARRDAARRGGVEGYQESPLEDNESLPGDVRAMLETALVPIAPVTYRGLTALHNRLVAWRVRLGGVGEGATNFRDETRRYDLGVNRYLVSPFLTMMAAIDIRWPELGVLNTLERSPSTIARALSRLGEFEPKESSAARTSVEPRGPGTLVIGERFEDLPILAALVRESRFSGSDLGDVKRSLRHLAQTWVAWQQSGAGVLGPARFLTITVTPSVNALESSRPIWSTGFVADEVRDWHIDLRSHIHGDRPQPAELEAARVAARALLHDDKPIRDFSGRLEIFAFAPAPFLIWFGSVLDREQSIVFYNARTELPYGPVDRLTFPDRGFYETVDVSVPNEPKAGASSEAIVLIDLTPEHKSTLGNLDRFRRRGAPVECRHHRLLTRRSGDPLEQGDLVPVLRDALEVFGELRRIGVLRIHIALAGPDFVAFFLGRQLKAQGSRFSLYDFYRDHHEYVFDLEESPSGDD